VLSVLLRYTDSDYLFGICKLFLQVIVVLLSIFSWPFCCLLFLIVDCPFEMFIQWKDITTLGHIILINYFLLLPTNNVLLAEQYTFDSLWVAIEHSREVNGYQYTATAIHRSMESIVKLICTFQKSKILKNKYYCSSMSIVKLSDSQWLATVRWCSHGTLMSSTNTNASYYIL
jgi:hypothetical protein